MLVVSQLCDAQVVRITTLSDDTSRPIAGAVWSLREANGRVVAIGMSDTAGRVLLSAERPGAHSLTVFTIGYERHRTRAFALDSGLALSYTHRARPTVVGTVAQAHSHREHEDGQGGAFRVRGRVLGMAARESDGVPLAGAEVMVRSLDGRLLSTSRTNQAGRFDADAGEEDTVVVSTRAVGYRPMKTRASPGVESELRLEPVAVTLAERRVTVDRLRVMGLDPRGLAGWIIDQAEVDVLRATSQTPGDLVRWRALPGVSVSSTGECVRIRMGPCALIVVDDVAIGDMKVVQLESVRAVVILRSVEAVNLFGSRGAGGAVVFSTR
jgi:hypothetical protein